MPATVAGAALIVLAACADGEGPEAVVPPAIAATVDVPEPVVKERPEEAPAPATVSEAEASSTLPTVEFPSNAALLASFIPGPYVPKDGLPPSLDFVRIYRQNDGELAREILFSRDDLAQLPESGHYEIYASRDAYTIVMVVCPVGPCSLSGVAAGGSWDLERDLPGTTDLYESKDGGVTWGQVLPFDMPDLALESPASCFACFHLPDGRLLLSVWLESYEPDELVGPQGAAEGRAWFGDDPLYWPTTRDSETREKWPIRLPYDVLRSGDVLLPLGVQRGPFLRVTGASDCLPVLSDQSLDAEELACAAERVLLTDLGEISEMDGTNWHRVRTPSGVEGWADGRGLE